MNMKMNTDFLKNIGIPPLQLPQLSQIQLPKVPKLKKRKVFTSQTPVTTTQHDTIESNTTGLNFNPPKPRPSVLSPTKLSTISSLVDGAPTYDYSFGDATLPDHIIEKIVNESEPESEQQQQHQHQSNKQKSKSSTEKLSKRISKQYKELSEFKFKDIFGKKTQSPQDDDYENKKAYSSDNRFYFKRSNSDDDDIEIQSIPDRQQGNINTMSFISTDQPNQQQQQKSSLTQRRKFGSIKQSSVESTSSQRWSFPKASSLQVLSGIKPNESSLWKMKKSKSKSSNTVDITNVNDERRMSKGNEEKSDNKATEKSNRFGRQTFKRQNIDAAFDKAKKSVNSKFRQLKFLQSKQIGSKDSEKSIRKPARGTETVIEIIDRRGSFDSFDSEKQLHEANLAVLRDEWIAGRIVACQEIPRCLLGPRDDDEDDDDNDEQIEAIAQVCIINGSTQAVIPSSDFESSIEEITDSLDGCPSSEPCLAVDIPKRVKTPPLSTSLNQQSWIPNNQIILAFYQTNTSASPPTVNKRSIFPDFPRGHSRKLSMDSNDSDSWIPEKLRGKTRSQAGLDKIDESSSAWKVNKSDVKDDMRMTINQKSIDIFEQGSEEIFEDFDTALQNVPVITVKKDSFDLEDKFFDRKSIEFSTDDEDEIDPDVSTIVESPQELSKIQTHETAFLEEIKNDSVDAESTEIIQNDDNLNEKINETPPRPDLNLLSSDQKETKLEIEENTEYIFNPLKILKNIEASMKEREQSIIEEIPLQIPEQTLPVLSVSDENEMVFEPYIPEYHPKTIMCNESKEFKINSSGISKLFRNSVKDRTQSIYDMKQEKKAGTSLFKQGSLRRNFSDGLETEHLTDVSVNKLISRFEKQKSSSNSSTDESPPKQKHQFTVEAIIESKGLKIFESPLKQKQEEEQKQKLSSPKHHEIILSKDENLNLTLLQQTSVDSVMEKLKNQESNEHIISHNSNRFKTGRIKSIEWAKYSKTFNRTIDIPVDNNDGDVFYSFEEDEDSKLNDNNNNTSVIMATTDVSSKINEANRNIRHIYNVAL